MRASWRPGVGRDRVQVAHDGTPKESYHGPCNRYLSCWSLTKKKKKLLATWMMIVQEQLERKDKHYWNINARANRLRAKIRDLRPVS